MKRLLTWISVLLLPGLAWCNTPTGGKPVFSASMTVKGTITVTPDGHVGGYALDHPEKLPAVVVNVLGRSIPHWRFDPTIRDGKAVEVKSSMRVRMLAKPVDGKHYSVSVQDTQFGDASAKRALHLEPYYKGPHHPPQYPQEAVVAHVSGTVFVAARIDRQGHVEKIATLHVDLNRWGGPHLMAHWRNVLAQAAMDAIRSWHFGIPNAGRDADKTYWNLWIPVAFKLGTQGHPADPYGKWVPFFPGPRHSVSWMTSAQPPAATHAADHDMASPGQTLHRIDTPRT